MENITLAELNASTDGEEDQQVGSVVAGQGGSTGFGGGGMGGQGGWPWRKPRIWWSGPRTTTMSVKLIACQKI